VNSPLKRTPLYDAHAKAGARMVPFGGWEMPVQYAGIIDEHRTVRTAVGLFDVSHMGEFEVEGPEARCSRSPPTTFPRSTSGRCSTRRCAIRTAASSTT
jgi:aminomethyltransferase